MIIKNVAVYSSEKGFNRGKINIEDELFADCGSGDVIDGEGCYAIPGLIDIHFHGCMGVDFCDGTDTAIKTMAQYEAENGICTICPATMTLSKERLFNICSNAAKYNYEGGAELVGIYLEGPFISKEKKGAQAEKYVIPPNIDLFRKLYKASKGLVKIIAVAPETDGALEFISKVKNEVVVSLAHTITDYETAIKAFNLGARQVTHLYNAMPPFHHRSPGLIGAALDSEHSKVELITDGVHIQASVVKATFGMFGDDRIILISDSMMATGLPDGDYELGGQAVKVVGNLSTLPNGTIAGSATNLMDCMRTAVKMGIPLESAIKCATENPAKAIGIFDNYGSIEAGKYANLVLLDKNLNIEAVYVKGNKISPFK